MKKQIWLRPDQVDLVISALMVVDGGLGGVSVITTNRAANMAAEFTSRRVRELIELIGGTGSAKP